MTERALRSDLPPLPHRMKHLPLDHRGFPVPWFVQWFVDGKPCDMGLGEPDFRVIDARKIMVARKRRCCWVCGESLGVHLAFVIGPMCAVNRIISEPPSHRGCAEFSAKACPFLSRPRMRRNKHELPEQRVEAAGLHLDRNPGVACLWIMRSFNVLRVPNGILFKLGEPEEVAWFCEGRTATREEVMAAIERGLPALREMAEEEGPEAIADLARYVERAMPLVPAGRPT